MPQFPDWIVAIMWIKLAGFEVWCKKVSVWKREKCWQNPLANKFQVFPYLSTYWTIMTFFWSVFPLQDALQKIWIFIIYSVFSKFKAHNGCPLCEACFQITPSLGTTWNSRHTLLTSQKSDSEMYKCNENLRWIL